MSTLALTWHLTRAGGRRGAATHLLAVLGTAVAALLLAVTLGALSGFEARADRVQWRTPAPGAADAGAPALQRTTPSAHDGREVVVVDLAATGRGAPPVPPGLAAFPAPGEVFLSPALADLVRERPGPELGARFGAVTGELGRAALAHSGELVAVLGRSPADPVMSAPVLSDPRRPEAHAGPAPVEDFAGAPVAGGRGDAYTALAVVAAVLLVVPLLVLAAAAARLGLARRDARLAALRLAGATPGQVLAMTVAESAATALAGGAAGVLGAVLLTPAASLVPVAGGRWYPSDLVAPPLALVSVVLGVVVLAAGSAAVALRAVLVAPLGVAASQTPRRTSAVRALVFAVLVLGFLWYSDTGGVELTGLIVVFTGVFAALAVVGPWVLALVGRVVVHRSRTAAALLAGRRMLDDPRGAWRVVGGVALTGFVAGTLALFPTGSDEVVWGREDRLDVAVPADAAARVAAELPGELAAAGVGAQVLPPGEDRGALVFLDADGGAGADGAGTAVLSVAVPGGGAQLEVARTVVGRVAPGSVTATGRDVMIGDDVLVADFRSASVIVLAVSFLVATVSAGTTAAASVLDRRRTYRQLALVGVPLAVLHRARALETQLPLVLLALGSTATGVVVAAPLTRLGLGGGGLDVGGLALLGGCLVLGLLGVRAATAASGPLLVRVTTGPARADD